MIYEDRNIAAIMSFCQNEDILRSLFNRRISSKRTIGGPTLPEPLLQVIQTMLCPLTLSDIGCEVYDFPSSQIAAYSPACKSPIFTGCYGGAINMDWILQQFNFWKYHFTQEAESTLYTDIDEIDPSELPKLWNSALSQQNLPALPKKWRGISAYLKPHEVTAMRVENPRDDIMDEFSSDTNTSGIQDLELEFAPHQLNESAERKFSDVCNAHHPKKRAKTRSDAPDDRNVSSKPRSFRLENSEGPCPEGEWIGDGWMSSLPSQSGIPGWQRMTMMKYWKTNDGEINELSLWCYEGVVLPGGKTIVGRWWAPDEFAGTEEQYSGPFVMWSAE